MKLGPGHKKAGSVVTGLGGGGRGLTDSVTHGGTKRGGKKKLSRGTPQRGENCSVNKEGKEEGEGMNGLASFVREYDRKTRLGCLVEASEKHHGLREQQESSVRERFLLGGRAKPAWE